jgi:hypothetical protein
MAVTRIQNNQITDQTIQYQKIAPGTLVGSVFNPTLTLNSNITIVGNLSVSGNSTTINSTNTYVNDPLIVFNNGYTGVPAYDIGMLVNRALGTLTGYASGQNTAFIWKEADQAFEAIVTTETGQTAGAIGISGYANIKSGNLFANSLTTTTGIIYSPGGVQNTPIGSVTPNTGAFTTGAFTTLQATNFNSGNAAITGGQTYIGTSGTPIANIYAGYASLTTAQITNDTAVNFYSGNVFINGGYITNLANIYVTTAYATNFSTPNLAVTTQSVTNLTATNFYTANARIAGGYLTGLSNVTTTFDTVTNLYAANATIASGTFTGAAVNAVAGNITTGYFGSLNTANAVVTGGYIAGISNISASYGTFTNFATGNAVITGGSLNGIPVGASSQSSGAFTTISGTNQLFISSAINSTTSNT